MVLDTCKNIFCTGQIELKLTNYIEIKFYILESFIYFIKRMHRVTVVTQFIHDDLYVNYQQDNYFARW